MNFLSGALIGVLVSSFLYFYSKHCYQRILSHKGDNHNKLNGGSNIEFILGKSYAILPEKDYVDLLLGGVKQRE